MLLVWTSPRRPWFARTFCEKASHHHNLSSTVFWEASRAPSPAILEAPFLLSVLRRAPSRRVFLSNSSAVSAGSCRSRGRRGVPSGLLRRSCFCSRRRRFQANQLGEPLTKLESGRSRLRQESVKTACSNAISRAPRTGTAAARVMLGRALLFFWLKSGQRCLHKWFQRRPPRVRRAQENRLTFRFVIAIKTGTDSTILLPCRSITQPFARCNLVLALQSIPSIALAINFQLLCSAACLLSVC